MITYSEDVIARHLALQLNASPGLAACTRRICIFDKLKYEQLSDLDNKDTLLSKIKSAFLCIKPKDFNTLNGTIIKNLYEKGLIPFETPFNPEVIKTNYLEINGKLALESHITYPSFMNVSEDGRDMDFYYDNAGKLGLSKEKIEPESPLLSLSYTLIFDIDPLTEKLIIQFDKLYFSSNNQQLNPLIWSEGIDAPASNDHTISSSSSASSSSAIPSRH